jgi:uncharacterized repeat protein (TIGR03806 family)
VLLLLAACDEPTTDTDDTPPATLTRVSNTSCLAVDRPTSDANITLTRVFDTLSFDTPVLLLQAPDDAARWWVVEQSGAIRVFDAAGGAARTAIDLSDAISNEAINEDGLLGMAFHPEFATNGDAFVNYTAGSVDAGTLHSVVSRIHSEDDGETFGGEEILLTVDQPYSNHDGGHLAFGPDGYLYTGFGDGGSAGDPFDNGQNMDALLGKMLRIDVDGGAPYAIPADNPYADGLDGAPEIYASGFRNPWRFSFDRASGELWVGDVGQNEWEEIDRVELGGNYGWNVREGAHCYSGRECEGDFVDPVVEYSHRVGQSILGGYVYHGTANPDLRGVYLYADTYAGTIFGLTFDVITGEASGEALLENTGLFPSTFAEGADGELYIADYATGRVYRIDPAGEPSVNTFPTQLSATGCVDAEDPTQPAAGMVPYDLNMPLWSDGAAKERWIALPDGETISVGDDGAWTFPVGSVLMKQFSLGGAPVETRLMLLHDDGNWSGYSYQWSGNDATLLVSSASIEVEGQTWSFPSRAQCLECHTASAGRVLGPRTEQLDREVTYPNGATGNQLVMLAEAGFLEALPTSDAPLPALDSDATVDARARAYLAANCAMCHRPEGTGGGPMDYRVETALADMYVCDEPPLNGDLGVADARIVTPGDPSKSVLSLRMHALDVHRMPPLGSAIVDTEGVAVIDAWIRELVCP